MPFRLILEHTGNEFSFILRRGENLVGSDPACDVVIAHPTVSRHHASLLLVVEGAGAEALATPALVVKVADLGSRNGTWVDDQIVQREARLITPAHVRFGSVRGVLDEIDAADSAPARLGSRLEPVASSSPIQAPPPATTASAGPLFRFTLGYLPEFLRAASEGVPVQALASRLGAALVEVLPCDRVQIVQRRPDRDMVIFDPTPELGRPPAQTTGEGWVVGSSERFRVSVRFTGEEYTRLYVPLIDAAALLLSLGEGWRSRQPPAGGSTRAAVPEAAPPDPPSLDPQIQNLYRRAKQIAAGDVNVLILGESGTGKELLARYLHAGSPRARGPLVALNCAALSRDLQEAELFGIERGIATGVEARPGRFEEADGGTLFLDEIGDMALDVQAKILRVLQEKEVYRIGGSKARQADVRILSATHRDLASMLQEGLFRTDLYHRIADWEVRIPPLRERRADLPNLASYFLAEAASRSGDRSLAFSEAALDAILRYAWPGNVRQLEREITKASLFVPEGGLLTTEHLSAAIVESTDDPASSSSLRDAMALAERRVIRNALHTVDGEVPAAARLLQVPESTLYRKIKLHDL